MWSHEIDAKLLFLFDLTSIIGGILPSFGFRKQPSSWRSPPSLPQTRHVPNVSTQTPTISKSMQSCCLSNPFTSYTTKIVAVEECGSDVAQQIYWSYKTYINIYTQYITSINMILYIHILTSLCIEFFAWNCNLLLKQWNPYKEQKKLSSYSHFHVWTSSWYCICQVLTSQFV